MLQRTSYILILLITVCLNSVRTEAQNRSWPQTNIKGVVVDSTTNEGIPYVAIMLKGSDNGVMADENGKFSISTSDNFIDLSISTMGYRNKEVYVNKGKDNNITIKMQPTGVALKEVVVKPKREKYSKKNNPAVDFVEKLMARKHMHDPHSNDYFSYQKYNKITCGLNDFSNKGKEKWVFNKFKFINEYLDTSEVSGKPILNLSVKEQVSDIYNRKNPHAEKELVIGLKHAGVDEMFDEESVKRFLEDVFREVDIFGNDVNIMQNRFVSPLSAIGTNFYKYYLNDTVKIDGVKCIDLSFAPHTAEAFGFTGRIYVPANDTTYFIKKVILNVPKAINLNYVQSIYIEQEFEKASDGSRLKTKDDMTVEFQVLPSTQGLYARRMTMYSDFSFKQPENLAIFSKEGKQIVTDDANYMPDEFWNENRRVPIKKGENTLKRLLARLREVPAFYWGEKAVVALVTGYVHTADTCSKFDFGPLNTMISGNALEGTRFRVGGLTTAYLNDHLFSRGYLAYGTSDEKLKYSGELEYSFNKKKYHSMEFPIHSIKLLHSYDVDQLGQHYMYTNTDNIFLAWKRQKDDKMTYLRRSKLEYKLETKCGFSVTAGVENNIEYASKFMPFEDGFGNIYRNYKETSFYTTLRYAPGEKFYQTKTFRIPINLDAPVFSVTQTIAPKGFLGNRYMINKTEMSIQKRFWFSAFGYTDVILKAGKVWSRVPYPNLLIPNANLSYTVQPESYSLMNAMEFMNDQYISWDITYWINGALMNRLPLIKYLKLREVVSFRGIYGDLNDKNNPEYNNELFRYPTNARCQTMKKEPYMEVGVGLDNILTFLRLDYVWRLTYRENPGIDKSGLRVALHFTF
ncbi:MAG: DUF5686 and carboxypeptidase regulatory-like domain-containing protein [Muribaculaceae bacterium]|jgi:hypothetical protein|nr:DUF5686 and carboxypeptidase regulatory-like domain-containing protein [Muribaculaceae bacterium]